MACKVKITYPNILYFSTVSSQCETKIFLNGKNATVLSIQIR